MSYLSVFITVYLLAGCLFTLIAPHACKKLHRYSFYKGRAIHAGLSNVLIDLINSMYTPEGLRVIIAWPSHVIRIGKAYRVLKAHRELLQLDDALDRLSRKLESFEKSLGDLDDGSGDW